MSTINWGIIGLGNIAYKFASGFDEVKNSKLVSIASKNSEKLEKFQKKFNIDKNFCFNEYEKVLLNNKVDIVYIALPHNLHSEWIIKCINEKKNILSEKPATVNLQEIRKINQKLNNSNVFFAEGFMYRFHPQTSALVEVIRQNEIGELLKMESFFGINIVDVRIKRADLPPANSEAIYKRMQTEREREAKEFRAKGAEMAVTITSTADKEVTVILANAQKKSEIMKGEGDGQKNKIFADAFGQDPEFFAFYRAMQAYQKALIGGETSMILSPDSEFFKFFGNINQKAE